MNEDTDDFVSTSESEGFHHSKTLYSKSIMGRGEKSVVYQIFFALYFESTGIISNVCSVKTKVL